ncbi:hypothetical protein CSKR_102839 [Clonorchis sinensis]|uniref:Uncharacterized protein n=1 Tax=Clonorchis sinensis TaxID=79923 RepID=A0A8T1M002_CLOSI|nr:hypothetical protein CSKR_102839 [Clonorchis sinensis]
MYRTQLLDSRDGTSILLHKERNKQFRMQLLFILFVAFIGVAKVTTFPHSELTTNIATDGAYTKQSTESAEADFITSVYQNHQHSTDVSTTNFEESTGLSNGAEGGGSDSTYPSRPIQSSDVYTSLKGVSDHVTAGPNQDFTTTGAVDDYTE